jgi:tetratricopeptide (TPR) repeat protein
MRSASLVAAVLALALGVGRSARACGWDSESYYAEAHSLPCVYDAILGHYARHSNEYYETRIAAADAALAWAPFDVAALDDKAIALLKLGRLEDARAVMLKRAEADPTGYGTHANLGTLTTFTGEYDQALVHIDRAMAIEPQAHFGREKYHRQLVVFLQGAAKDPARRTGADFLGLELTDAQRFAGSPALFKAAGMEPAAFDALVSMIAVYGADRMSDLYFAFGDLLALQGDFRLAWTAYKRASELDHPRKAEIKRWLPRLYNLIGAQHPERRREPPPGPVAIPPAAADDSFTWSEQVEEMIHREGGYLGIDAIYKTARTAAANYVDAYQDWERRQLRHGLPVWRAEGMTAVYARQNLSSKRCRSPGVIEQVPAGGVVSPSPASPPTGAPAGPVGERYVAALEAAAEVRAECGARKQALAAVRAAATAALAAATPSLSSAIARDAALAPRLRAALGAITDSDMACRVRAVGSGRTKKP